MPSVAAAASDAVVAALLVEGGRAWRPPARLALSAWADAKYRLPDGDANAGRWTTLPYQRGIMDALSDPAIERVTVMKSARVGYTRMFAAAVGYYIEHDPCPILIVQPTIDDARRHSKEDLAPMLREIPELAQLIAAPRAKDSDNTILAKLFRGGSLLLVGANSARGFRGYGARVVIFDEIDGYPASAGTEGDQLALGTKRTESYWNRKLIAGSTPTLTGHSRIERLFESGDQRRYHVPCPTCGAFQVLRFGNLKWPHGQPERAAFVCELNGCAIEPRHKPAMLEAGEWRAAAPAHFQGAAGGYGHASFHIWAAYSLSPHTSWGQLAVEFTAAVAAGPTTHRTFVNTALGETWRESGEAPAWEPLLGRRETYAFGTCPAGVRFLTAGVDVQKDRLCYEVVGWGRGKSSWSIDYVTVPGDTSDLTATGPWGALDAVLGREYAHAAGGGLRVELLAVDSGWNVDAVYAWSRRHPTSRVLVVKGVSAGAALIGAPAPVDVTVRGRKLKRGVRVWPVNGAIAKSELYGLLRLEEPAAPGYCHFPAYGADYFRELTAEQLLTVITRRGFIRLEWAVLPGRRNEALDCRIYARSAASIHGLDRFTPRDWDALDTGFGPSSAGPEGFDDERPD